MKYRLIIFSIFSITLLLIGCEKDDKLSLAPTTGLNGRPGVKVVHASAYTLNPAIQLKLNDTRVSSNITYSYPFPGGGLNTGGNNDMDYLLANTGANKVSMSIPKRGSAEDSITLFSGTTTALEAEKFYDIFLSDTAANTKMLVVAENLDNIPEGFSRFRFANLMPNVPFADLYFGTQKVASGIAYNTISEDFLLPRDSTAKLVITLKDSSRTTAAMASYPTTASATYTVLNQRSVVIYSRGYRGVTGTRAPAISLFFNRYYK